MVYLAGMIAEQTRKNLLGIAKAFAKGTDLSLSTVSRKFHGKVTFLDDFARGACSVTVSKLAEMVQAFSDEWPATAKWPATRPIKMERPPRSRGKKVAG